MKNLYCIFFLLISTSAIAQITGTVTDEKGNNLPYVSVYLENAIIGTTTNDNGFYELAFTKTGKQTVVFQFLGYKTVKKQVNITALPYTVNAQLLPQEVLLKEVIVSSKENPANRIIRNAIASKEKNTRHLEDYTADFYSKGLMRVKNAPKKFMGQKISFPFPLDSTRSGIIYLSETVSKITSQKNPKKFKERIVASKISGFDNGVSFNRANEFDSNIYKNTNLIINTNVISPIADYAFSHYTYKLVGAFYDDKGYLVNKIKLIPKRANDKVYNGHIYIVEDIWAVYGAELTINGKQLSNPVIKELSVKQDYKYLPKYKAWYLLVQTFTFKAGMFNFDMSGRFSAAYSNYNLTPKFTKNTFTNEILSFDKGATKKDSLYWNKLRPMPLTIEEQKDYLVKDSIKVLKKSKKYLDSIDAKQNKFNLTDIAFGYSYQNSYKKWNVTIKSPIKNLEFNTIQGWNTSLSGSFNQRLNEFGKWYRINTDINYGFSDKKWRPTASFTYKWNNIDKPMLQLSGGITTSQFNGREPISKLYNSIFSVFFERNYMKIYEKKFAKINFAKDVFNGVRLFSELEYAQRNPLINTSSYTMFNYKDRVYSTNNPINSYLLTPSFSSHSIFKGQLTARINFGNKYMSLPNERWNVGNKKYPTLYLSYRKLFGAKNSNLNSNSFVGALEQNINTGKVGEFSYYIKGGIFAKKKNIAFMDYLHANGNKLPIVLNTKRMNQFNLLDYYALSSNDKMSEWHTQHNFKGFILGKVPLLNKLNFHLVATGKALFTADNKPYTEYSVGLDNVGFGTWRFFRVDYVRSNFGGTQKDGFVFSINLLD